MLSLNEIQGHIRSLAEELAALDRFIEFFERLQGPMTIRQMGRLGGRARARKMTAKQRSESARRAVLVRWEKYKRRAGGKPVVRKT